MNLHLTPFMQRPFAPLQPTAPRRTTAPRAPAVGLATLATAASLAALVSLAGCGDAEPGAEPAGDTVATATTPAVPPPADPAATGPTGPAAGPAGAVGAADPAAGSAGGGFVADTAPLGVAIDSPVTALDSVRLELRRLGARVDRSTRATDSLLALLTRGAAGAAGAGVAGGGAEPGTGPDASSQEARRALADTAGDVGPDARILQDAAETARSYGIRAFWAVLVLVLTFFAVRAAAYALNVLSERSAERRLFFKRLVPIARIVLWTVAVYFVIRVIFAVDAQGLFAAAAAVGVAIGFAAQDLLKNIFGGLVIVFDQPFQVGDKIQVGESYGEVVSIGLRSTRIVTPDDSLVSVPNAQVVDSQVSNANSGALDCQVVTDLYLPGFVDEARAKAIAYQAAASSRYVYLQKPIVVLVKDEFRETFLTHLKVKAYVLDARYEFAFMSDVTERARAEFRRQGLVTPAHGARAWVRFADADGGADDGATGGTAERASERPVHGAGDGEEAR